jgi:FtsP/CotA-like multicopper oxidase with cupredoxin domain
MRVDVHNETDSAERIYWHGQGSALDAAACVPAHSMRRMELTPTRPGLYFYHSHVIAAANLDAGLYSGQAGGLLVEGESRPTHFDREWVVVLKECEPFIRRTRRGCEIAYRSVTLNGRMPGHGVPTRINSGERVLLHLLNASATEPHGLALPGHSFEVIALDGNPVPSPARVTTLQVSPAERISAIIEAPAGPIIEAPAGLHAPAEWIVRDAGTAGWDYTRVGSGFGSGRAGKPDAILDMVLTRHDAARSGFNSWSINGTSFSASDPRPLFHVRCGLRYRLRIRNTSDEILPLHLQRHRLEIVQVAGTPTAGVLKDVVTVGPHQQLEVDFVADSGGPALFYCTRQLHRDFGLMALIELT